MEIHQLRYFVAVAETESFSRAAERCHVTQPSLSQQIKKLETDLGQILFDRLPRGAVPTAAGHALLPRARSILAAINEARSAVVHDVESGIGPLAVGAIPTMSAYLLPPVLETFLGENPQCDLTLREDLTERLLEGLLAHELDLAILSTPIDEPRVEVEVVASETLLLMASPELTLPPVESLTIEALRDQPAIVIHEVHCLGQQIRDFCNAHRVATRVVCRSAQVGTVQRLVGLGLGLSLVPEMAAREDLARREFYQRLQAPEPTREIAIASYRDRQRSHLARRFVALLTEHLEAGAYRFDPDR